MKRILHNFKTGAIEIVNSPGLSIRNGHLLVYSSLSLVSAGTEHMLVEFGKAGWIEKIRKQPEKAHMVLEKLRTNGFHSTYESVKHKLDNPLPLGYCNVGKIMEIGKDVQGFSVGERVVSNGSHAEMVCVPQNLCARIPDNVDDECATFTIIGAIALQGIRLVKPTLGESIVVSGLGLVGLMAVQLLRANGCRVLGIDINPERVALARQFGAEVVDLSASDDPMKIAESFSRGRGVDAVLITASSKSNEPVSQAAKISRKRGRIVLVGITGLKLSRDDFYEKEITFQVSCSYGPGRYDPEYEENGHDYPVGYVRWTEQRNMEAVLDMMASGVLDVRSLITHRFIIDDAVKAYDLLTSDTPSLGILLKYPGNVLLKDDSIVKLKGEAVCADDQIFAGIIGAGNYAGKVLIPAFKSAGAGLKYLASTGGVNGMYYGKKYGFENVTTDTEQIFSDSSVNTVVIATRHDSHAVLVKEALDVGKHVFCEKPLCLTQEELSEIENTLVNRDVNGSGMQTLLMVGFNRRFAPHVVKIKQLLIGVNEPKSFIMTVNAGAIPQDHWTQDAEVGGGRIIGEACHFIDLLRFLANASIINHQTTFLGSYSITKDNVNITITFADGSIGTIHYLANGNRSFPKERLDIFAAGRVLQLDNFRKLVGYGWPGFRKMQLFRQDKGQMACVAAFLDAIRNGKSPPIPIEEIIEVSRVSIAVAKQ